MLAARAIDRSSASSLETESRIRSLANLAASLPVQLVYRTRYWVSVGPRQAA